MSIHILYYISLRGVNIFMTKEIYTKSVFKNGTNKISKADFTKKWIELINQMENGKENQ